MSRNTFAHIDNDALHHNIHVIRKHAPTQQLFAMVKAHAYGHGLIPISQALTDKVDALGVACLEEAMTLREAGISTPILLMEGFYHAHEIPLIEQHDLIPILHHRAQIAMLERAVLKKGFNYWIKIDTGMHRLGFPTNEFQSAWKRLQNVAGLKHVGFLTHFSSSDDLHDPATQEQTHAFKTLTKGLPGLRSLANSAGILAWPDTLDDVVRPGLMLYGISPFHDKIGTDFGLKPVMTRTSQLIAIHDLQAGDGIGYHHTWHCPEPMRVGTVAIGYGDGYPRHIPSEGTPVLIHGRPSQVIGRVSMDMLAIDLRQHPNVILGDTVTLWGPGLPVETIARYAETSPYEIVTQVIRRT